MNSIAAVALLLFGKVGDHAVGREEEPREALGTGPKKTPFSSNISFISESFLFFNTKSPSADVCNESRWLERRTAYDLDRINKIYRIE